MDTEELLPGERLFWAGEPRQGSVDALGALIVVVVPVAGLFWLWGAISVAAGRSTTAAASMALFFVGWLIAGAPIVRRRLIGRRGGTYRVTDRRLVVADRLTVRAFWLDRLPAPQLRGERIVFETAARLPARNRQTISPPELRGLADPAAAMHALAAARAGYAALAAPEPPTPVDAVPADVRLLPGERVLWTGRPTELRWWYGQAEVPYAVGSVFAGAATVLFGLGLDPFVTAATSAIGLATALRATVAVPLLRRRRLRRTRYVLTNRRLITRARTEEAVDLRRLHPPTVQQGAVLLEPVDPMSASGRPQAVRELLGLPDPERAAHIIARAQLAQPAPTVPAPRRPEPEREDDSWSRWD